MDHQYASGKMLFDKIFFYIFLGFEFYLLKNCCIAVLNHNSFNGYCYIISRITIC
jgi:hypothetical protein